MNYLEEIDSFLKSSGPKKTLQPSSQEVTAQFAQKIPPTEAQKHLPACGRIQACFRLDVRSWLDHLTDGLRIAPELAVGIGLAAYYRDGGSAVPYRSPHMVMPPEYLPAGFRERHMVRFGLIVGKYPGYSTCDIGSGADRYWMPTKRAVDLLRKLAPVRPNVTEAASKEANPI